jgi:hypothetical protein
MRHRFVVVAAAVLLSAACSSETSPGGGGGGGTGGGAPDAGSTVGGTGGGADAGSTGGGDVDAGNGSGGGSSPDAGAGGGSGSGSGGGSGGADAGQPDAGTGGGGADAGTAISVPEQLTTGENATGLAIDASNVYWMSRKGPFRFELHSMLKSGGAVTTLAATRNSVATSLVAPGDGVLWEAMDCAEPCDYPGAGHEWAIFSTAPGGYRRVAVLYGSGGLAANATTAYSRSFNTERGRWDLLGCARDGSGCTRLVTDNPIMPPVYLHAGMLFWINQPSDNDFGPHSNLLWNDADAGFHARGGISLPVVGITGLRVNADDFAVRSAGKVYTGNLQRSGQAAMIWAAPNGDDVDINRGRVYWNQSPDSAYPGCLGSANLDGSDGHCLDDGAHKYGGVRVDDAAVYYLRDGEIWRVAK